VTSADKLRRLCSALGVAAALAACSVQAGRTATPTSIQNPTITPIQSASRGDGVLTATGAATAPITATAAPDTILVWWPSILYPEAESPAANILQEELASYQASRPRTVTVRVKRAEGLGGIYQTLRSGSVAAPSVMPDLAMMRRSDLVQAVSGNLIEPIDMRLLAAEDIFPSALALGVVQGTQYGVPYTLEIQHAVYRTSVTTTPPKTTDDLLQTKQIYLFPAAVSKGANSTLLAQYMASGGRLHDDKGAPTLDKTPLVEVLRYYERAVEAGVADSDLLEYNTFGQYWPLFVSGKASIAQVDSTTFLAQRASLTGIAALPVPMPSGTPMTIIDGWMWVVTTADPDRQARALDLLIWLLRADQQGQLMRELGVLPSRRSALDTWGDDSYTSFVRSLLQQPAVPPLDMIDGNVATALQTAFMDVLLGRKSADIAANDTLRQLGIEG
jgi:ABC-type glycerol-3-phosphate transport system substrate-binding protein